MFQINILLAEFLKPLLEVDLGLERFFAEIGNFKFLTLKLSDIVT